MDDSVFLFSEWCSAHIRAGVWPSVQEFKRVLKAYSQKGRYYHDLKHIADCLRFINRFFPKTKNVHLVKLAIFYHDIVMDFGQKDNELRSAQRWNTRRMFRTSVRRRVYDLIMLTAGHDGASDELGDIMNDADLHVLGQSHGLYIDYAKGIWKEYQFVGIDAYVANRSLFLKGFVEKSLFRTKKMKHLLEDRAKKNLRREINILRYKPHRITG